MAALKGATAPRFVRDRLTWLGYVSLSIYAYCLYALGPETSFLRHELHLSYTVASLHSTLWAGGAVFTGLTFDLFTRRWGRRRVLWASAVCTAAGSLMFFAGHQVGVTLAAALVLGTGGTFLGAACSVSLADHHGERRDRALLEANVGASATGVAVPALLGLLAGTASGWRPAALLPVLAVALLFAGLGRTPLPEGLAAAGAARRLPLGFWAPCLMVALAVAIEFALIFYAVPLLGARVGLSTSNASALLSLFIAGELCGRLVGARLTRRPGRAMRLIGGALVVALGGFLVLWLGGATVISALALFVTGLGVGNLYPLSLALALGASGGMTDRAMARTQIAVGVAVGTAPLLLGVLSDHVGVLTAVAVEPAMIVAAALVLLAVRAGRTAPAAAAAV